MVIPKYTRRLRAKLAKPVFRGHRLKPGLSPTAAMRTFLAPSRHDVAEFMARKAIPAHVLAGFLSVPRSGRPFGRAGGVLVDH